MSCRHPNAESYVVDNCAVSLLEKGNCSSFRQLKINYLITESEVVTGKSQTEALPYWRSDSEVNTVGRGLRFSRNDWTVEVIKLFIIWHNQQK